MVELQDSLRALVRVLDDTLDEDVLAFCVWVLHGAREVSRILYKGCVWNEAAAVDKGKVASQLAPILQLSITTRTGLRTTSGEVLFSFSYSFALSVLLTDSDRVYDQ